MVEFFASFLIFFDAAHPAKTIAAGALLVFLGMAVYYIATRRRAASAALKVLGIAIAAYGGGHVYGMFMTLTA
ncbi:hypothetical protein N5K21_27375 [Rhizobium pusense]|uniref:hypothetical protein n=1 Tax=Agrobacterium pusense TaxID=648995 RepID=UPI00244AA273|nr:hypothetical protein [Agrobacterium pusense]MDH2092444.1 hypothetical protein [Agrobacterium pusense]